MRTQCSRTLVTLCHLHTKAAQEFVGRQRIAHAVLVGTSEAIGELGNGQLFESMNFMLAALHAALPLDPDPQH